MLVTSRSISEVEIEPSIRIGLDYPNEHVNRDINRYVSCNDCCQRPCTRNEASRLIGSKITSERLKVPSKRFLWAQLAIRIAKALTLRVLRNKLDRRQCTQSSLTQLRFSQLLPCEEPYISL